MSGDEQRPDISVTTFERDRTVLVALRVNNLNHFSARILSESLRPLIQDRVESQDQHIVLNVGQVEIIDSSGIGMFIALKNLAEEAGIALRLCCAKQKMQAIFRIMQLHRFIDVFRTEEDALEACRGAKSS